MNASISYNFNPPCPHPIPASTPPTLVHCSAGVGRSGTFIALNELVDAAMADGAAISGGAVDVVGVVQRLRQDRMKMVQTEEQLSFIYRVLPLVCSRNLDRFLLGRRSSGKIWMLKSRR